MADIRDLLAILRSHGVKSCEVDQRKPGIISVEFFPPTVPDTLDKLPDAPRPTLKQMMDSEGAGICGCGHPELQHNETGCYKGCSPEECAKKPT